MMKTKRHPHLNAETIDYVVNSVFEHSSQNHVIEIQRNIGDQFKEIWNLPPQSLHVTLMDWLAPFVEYPQPVDELYSELSDNYVSTLKDILRNVQPFKIHFNEIFASETTIVIRGDDGGVHNRIREEFLEKVELLPGTKPPAEIVHSSIARFSGPCDKKKIDEFLRDIDIDFTSKVSEFRIVRESIMPMLDFNIIERIPL